MTAVLWMYIQHYTRQGYPLWIALCIGAIFLLGYILGSLSIADSLYVTTSLTMAGLEFFCIGLSLYGAGYAQQRLNSNYNHMLHAQGLSYVKLYTTRWFIGLIPLLYVMLIAGAASILFSQMFAVGLLVLLGTVLKAALLYTVVYLSASYMQRFFSMILGIVLYMAAYSVPLIYMLAEQSQLIIRWILLGFVRIIPQFINYNLDIGGQLRLQENFFTIAIVQGMYILGLLGVGCALYNRMPRK